MIFVCQYHTFASHFSNKLLKLAANDTNPDCSKYFLHWGEGGDVMRFA